MSHFGRRAIQQSILDSMREELPSTVTIPADPVAWHLEQAARSNTMSELCDKIRAERDAELDQLLIDWPANPKPPGRWRRFWRLFAGAFVTIQPRPIPAPKDLGCAECRKKDILIRVLMNHDH
jgi:hypothetical protein